MERALVKFGTEAYRTGTLGYHYGGGDMGEATTDPVRFPPAPPIPKIVPGWASSAPAKTGRRAGEAVRLRIHREPADLRQGGRDQRPGVDQGPVHHEPRPRRPGVEPRRDPRAGLDVQPPRRRAPPASQAAGPAVSRQKDAGLRAHHRRRGDARDRHLAGGRRVRDDAADDAHHAQRDPAGGVRCGRRRAGRIA